MNTLIPFICLGIGAAISWRGLPGAVLKGFDTLINIALVILMLVIGLNIGTSPQVMGHLGRIGFNCAMLSLFAILASAFLVALFEKTVLPLEETRKQFASRDFEDKKIRTLLRYLLDNNADATLYSDEGIFFAPCSSRKFFVEGYNVGVEPPKQAPIIDIGQDFPEQAVIPRFNKILLINPGKVI